MSCEPFMDLVNCNLYCGKGALGVVRAEVDTELVDEEDAMREGGRVNDLNDVVYYN